MGRASFILVMLVARATLAECVAPTGTAASDRAGGAGGVPFALACQADQVLVGIYGRAGKFVDSIGGLCRSVDEAGNWTGEEVRTEEKGGDPRDRGVAASLPDPQPQPFTVRCPEGMAVVGMAGRAALWMDRLELTCRRLAPHPNNQEKDCRWKMVTVTGNYSRAPGVGGRGGKYFAPRYCPQNKPANRLVGSAGRYLYNLMLMCNSPMPAAPGAQRSSQEPARPRR
jgi:hypothetical protein